MADDNRINLSDDLNKIANDLLEDVKAATDEVKQRQAAIKIEGQRDSDKARSRKLSALIVGIAVIVIVLLAYFRGPDSASRQQADAASRSSGKSAITCPVTTPTATPGTRGAASGLPNRASQSSNHPPSDDYEQRDSGM